AVNWRLPTKLMLRMPGVSPSSISKTRSTRFCSSGMSLGSTGAAKRLLRRGRGGKRLAVPRPLGGGVTGAGVQLHFLREGFVRELVIPLEGDAVDDRILDDAHDERIPFAPKRHVGEETGREQALERLIDPVAVEGIARLHLHIGAHRLGLDAL